MKLQLYKGIVCLIIDSNRRERERERERERWNGGNVIWM